MPHSDEGKRVKLIRCEDPHTSIPHGTEGTIVSVDSLGTRHINWDDGHSLGLIPGVDAWRIIEERR